MVVLSTIRQLERQWLPPPCPRAAKPVDRQPGVLWAVVVASVVAYVVLPKVNMVF